MSFSPKIAVIGGGPSGLTLARLLQRSQIPCTVFESDASRDARGQGGSLDLHIASGQQAIVEAGLWDQFAKHMRPEGEAFTMADPSTGHVLYAKKAPMSQKPKKPEIMRYELRTILLDSLEQDSVRWGSKCSKVEAAEDGKYDVHLERGEIERGYDLVVGADGAWSKVRPLLTTQEPFYSGVSWMQTVTPADQVRPDIDKLVGAGAMIAGRNKRLMWSQRYNDGSLQAGFYLRCPETWVKDIGIDWSNPLSAKKEVVDKYMQESDGWAEPFRHMILGGQDRLAPKPLYMLPVDMSWTSRKGITLIGDSAHLMTPFAGVGVNLAVEDALVLARCLKKRRGSTSMLTEGLQEFERDMFKRAATGAATTYENLVGTYGKPDNHKF